MSTRHLGELGTRRDPVDVTFAWFGETIRVNPQYSDLLFIEFLDAAATVDMNSRTAAQKATMAFLRDQIHPEDWDKFVALNKANNQQFADMLDLAGGIVKAVAGFPTGRPSDSSDGPQPTKPSSTGASSSVASAMAQLQGRPDLKMAIYQAEVERRRAAAPAN
jgi:hypothetical protein